MMHVSRERLSGYVRNQLAEQARADVEQHLVDCQACLQIYIDELENVQAVLPVPDNAEQWTSAIMERILRDDKVSFSRRWYQHPVFHFGTAAAFMLIITVSGLLPPLLEQLPLEGGLPEATLLESSYSDKLMLRTLSVIDQIMEKGGVRH